MNHAPAIAILALSATSSLVLAADAGISQVLGSIDIGAGQHAGDLSTVNGSIHVGEGAAVGRANTVNGGITLERLATAAELHTVNGSIHLSDAARVTGPVHAVNGSLDLNSGADVAGNLTNVNGAIRVTAAHVGGSIDTVRGDIDIAAKARVDGGIVVHRDSGSSGFDSPPRVVIGPGAVVKGTLRFERTVKLYVSERATVGSVEGASVVKFSGEHPPE